MCSYHAGYYRIKNKKSGDGVWSCCGGEERECEPCTKDYHKHADWPEEDAKKYFFDKPLRNPAENWNRSD